MNEGGLMNLLCELGQPCSSEESCGQSALPLHLRCMSMQEWSSHSNCRLRSHAAIAQYKLSKQNHSFRN